MSPVLVFLSPCLFKGLTMGVYKLYRYDVYKSAIGGQVWWYLGYFRGYLIVLMNSDMGLPPIYRSLATASPDFILTTIYVLSFSPLECSQ